MTRSQVPLVNFLPAKHHLHFHWHHPKCCKATSRYLNKNLAGTSSSDLQKDVLLGEEMEMNGQAVANGSRLVLRKVQDAWSLVSDAGVELGA